MEKMGIIYLIQPAELVGTNRFKIGCSTKDDLSRIMNGYKKGTKILNIVYCFEPFEIEKKIKEIFNQNFKLIAGIEYFEGNEWDIRKIFIELTYNNFFNEYYKSFNLKENDEIEKDVRKWLNDIINNIENEIKTEEKRKEEKLKEEIKKINAEIFIKEIKNKNKKLEQRIINLNEELVNGSNTFLNWFKKNYEITQNKKDFIIINNIVDKFKNSKEYSEISKNRKKEIKKNKIISMFQNDIFYSKFFKKDTKKDDKRYTNILNNFIPKDND